MADTRCSSVRVLDLRGPSPVCDFFILGTGTSGRQMRSVADEVAELAESRGLGPTNQVSGSGDNWIAVDLFHAVVHLFSHDGRMYYDLDNLWAEAPDIDWREPGKSDSK